MIVVDTNVISELWRAEPAAQVLDWMDRQMIETLYLSVITVAELRFGLATMREGKRRAIYVDRLEREVIPAFSGRILPFDLDASQAYAELMGAAKAAGNIIGKADGYIAASAMARGYMVATRDIHPFKVAGLAVINPWETV